MPRLRSNRPFVKVADLLSSLGVVYFEHGEDPHATDGWIQLYCPFCEGSEPHLGFNYSSQVWRCWNCGRHPMRETLGLVTGLRGSTLVETLARYSSTVLDTPMEAVGYSGEVVYPCQLGPLHEGQEAWLRRRRYDPEKIVAEYGVKGCPPGAGNWSNRLLIPITSGGVEVAYMGASITKRVSPPYLTPNPSMAIANPKHLLYGLDLVPAGSVIVVEGILDMWRLGPGAVATFGTSWTMEQALLLKAFERRFVLFDTEPEAQQHARELANVLAAFPGRVELLRLPAGDPDDLQDREAADLMLELGFR